MAAEASTGQGSLPPVQDTDIKLPADCGVHERDWTPAAAQDVTVEVPEGLYFLDPTAYFQRVAPHANLAIQFSTTHVNRLRSYMRDHMDTLRATFLGSMRLAGHTRKNGESMVMYCVQGGQAAALAVARALVSDMHIVRVARRVFVADGLAPDMPSAVERVAAAAPGFVTPEHAALASSIQDGSAAQEGETTAETAARLGLSTVVFDSIAAGRVPVRFNVAPRQDLPAIIDRLDDHPVLAGATKGYVAMATFFRLEGVPGVYYSTTPPDTFFGHLGDLYAPASGAVSRAYYKLREAFVRGGLALPAWFTARLAQPQRDRSKAQKRANWAKHQGLTSAPVGAASAGEAEAGPESSQVPRDTAPPAAERVGVQWSCYDAQGPAVLEAAVRADAAATRDARAPMCTDPVLVGLDVGAAPGGWTRGLASTLGAKLVLAVDPAELASDLPPNVVHIRKRFQDAISELKDVYGTREGGSPLPPDAPLPRYIDAYVCDMNVPIDVSLRLLFQALPLLTGNARLALTVKNFNGNASAWRDGVRHCEEALALVCRPGTARRFHLFSNGREEQTLTGLLRSASELDGVTQEALEAILATRWVGDRMSADPAEIEAYTAAQVAARKERDARRKKITKESRKAKVARTSAADAASAASQA